MEYKTKPLIVSYRGQKDYSFRKWTPIGIGVNKMRLMACEVFDVNLGGWFIQIIGINLQNRIATNALIKKEQAKALPFKHQTVAGVELTSDQIRAIRNILAENQKLEDNYLHRLEVENARRVDYERVNKENWKKAARVVYTGKYVKKILGYDPDVGPYDKNIDYSLYL